MIRLTSSDGSPEETFESLDELRVDLTQTAQAEYTETVMTGIIEGGPVIVNNGKYTDLYEIL